MEEQRCGDCLKSGGARYIGAPLVSTTQQYTSCMITTPGDVQWEPGSVYEEEFLTLAAMFEARSFPGYVTIKSATRESALTKIAKVEYDMGYQTIACEGQTILGFLDGDGQEGKRMVMQENGREITYRIEDNQLVREKNIVGSADWRNEWQTID